MRVGRGRCTRGHSAVLEYTVPKKSVSPIQDLKKGIPGKSPGSYESLLQAGETENPKARGAKTGLGAKGNWGRK